MPRPKKPAPVSGPGALARRTDGGPGSATQPIRAATGQAYGERQATVEAQQAAPLPDSTGGGTAPGAPAQAPQAPPVPSGGVFGPTNRPGENPLQGMAAAPGDNPIAQDVDGFLRVLYSKFPHPGIHQLIRKDTRL